MLDAIYIYQQAYVLPKSSVESLYAEAGELSYYQQVQIFVVIMQ
jgi:hypothetical protein